MKYSSIRKISILGLILTAASAVTASVLSRSSDKIENEPINGSLTNDNGLTSMITCTASDGYTNQQSMCYASTWYGSSTTQDGFNGSNDTASGGVGLNTTYFN